MKTRIMVFAMLALFVVGLMSGCGGSGNGATPNPAQGPAQITATPPPTMPPSTQDSEPPLSSSEAKAIADQISAVPTHPVEIVGSSSNQFVAIFNGSTGCMEIMATASECF